MAEAGLDISNQRSKHVDEVKNIPFDYVVTVCDHANEHCPLFPGRTKVIHVGFNDPPALAREVATQEDAINIYRRSEMKFGVLLRVSPNLCPPEIPNDAITTYMMPLTGKNLRVYDSIYGEVRYYSCASSLT